MKRKRHSPEQIIGKLREADAMLASGATIAQVCQKIAVSEQTFHRWRNHYGGMKAGDARRLKELGKRTPSSRLGPAWVSGLGIRPCRV